MIDSTERVGNLLEREFGDRVRVLPVLRNELVVELRDCADVVSVCESLRDREGFCFEQMMDLCGVDYLDFGRETSQRKIQSPAPTRFAVVYQLLSISLNQRLRLRAFVDGEPPVLPSVTSVWAAADWYEREAFDLFGIVFDGHPDLRRLLTDYGFIGHPFRKDFPLVGHVEMRYDPEKGRVVYQPVSIEERILVPRVIRAGGDRDRDS